MDNCRVSSHRVEQVTLIILVSLSSPYVTEFFCYTSRLLVSESRLKLVSTFLSLQGPFCRTPSLVTSLGSILSHLPLKSQRVTGPCRPIPDNFPEGLQTFPTTRATCSVTFRSDPRVAGNSRGWGVVYVPQPTPVLTRKESGSEGLSWGSPLCFSRR